MKGKRQNIKKINTKELTAGVESAINEQKIKEKRNNEKQQQKYAYVMSKTHCADKSGRLSNVYRELIALAVSCPTKPETIFINFPFILFFKNKTSRRRRKIK